MKNLSSSFLYGTRHHQHDSQGTERQADYLLYVGLGRHTIFLCGGGEGKPQCLHTSTLLSEATWMILIESAMNLVSHAFFLIRHLRANERSRTKGCAVLVKHRRKKDHIIMGQKENAILISVFSVGASLAVEI